MDVRTGTVIYGATDGDQYQVVRPLGNGMFGSVYEVQDRHQVSYAMKTITTAGLNEEQRRALFNEGKLATEVHHPNVIRVLAFHDGDRYPSLPPYILMEYASEGTLDDLIHIQRAHGQPWNNDELRSMMTQLASGMQAVNAKVVHRDIKPDNILLDGTTLKIADFGLAKIVGAATRAAHTFKGINHVRYCAPEAWRLEANTPTMDMYSMGIVFYEMATLQHPYVVSENEDLVDGWHQAHLTQVPPDPKQKNPDLDIALRQVIMKMIQKRPGDRYATWGDVLQRLQFGASQAMVGPDVQFLVERAITTQQKIEAERLATESRANEASRARKLISYAFHEIVEAARPIVTAFTDQSDTMKLALTAAVHLVCTINCVQRPGPKVSISAKIPDDQFYLDNQLILAWGGAQAPSERGFNLVLVRTNPDDLYGQWWALHVTHTMYRSGHDKRPEPFPFKLTELPRELQVMDVTAHIYHTERRPFDPKFLDPLVEELVQ